MQEFFQLPVATFRQHDPHMYVKIAPSGSFERKALFFQAQHTIRARPCRYFHGNPPVQRFDLLLAAENGVGKFDRQVHMDTADAP